MKAKDNGRSSAFVVSLMRKSTHIAADSAKLGSPTVDMGKLQKLCAGRA